MTDLVSGKLTGHLVHPGQLSQPGPSKTGRLPWVGQVNQALVEGLANSQWLDDVQADQMAAGRQICLDLWPFILRLPDNIKSVQDKIPATLEPAKLFLGKLADEERSFQDLYVKQCELAGLSHRDLMTSESEPTLATSGLAGAMSLACQHGDVLQGIQAVVAAELAATQFARAARDAFELYFAQHAGRYTPGAVDEGLAWLRLHAKTNTRQAIWMNRMLASLSPVDESLILPPTVQEILGSVFRLWRVDQTIVERWL